MQPPDSPSVLTRRQGRIGRITLNRPRALNALDLPMLHMIDDALRSWRDDPAIHAVVIEGAGGRAFCAGGDIRAVRDAVIADETSRVEAFFSTEYALNLAIATYPKPYVALVDGICMGGGIGVSVHGTYRAASEAALFAMPETAIGFFPDVGATYFLPRLRGAVGLWMALTGARLDGAAAAWCGLATHFVTRDRIAGLADAIAEDGLAALAVAAEPPTTELAERRDAIDRCFGADSVAEILRRLELEDTVWAREQLETLARMSPSSKLWTFDAVRRGAASTLPDSLQAELALSRHVTRHPDFREGVRAMVVDKDRSPRWSPPTLDEVDPATIAALFA